MPIFYKLTKFHMIKIVKVAKKYSIGKYKVFSKDSIYEVFKEHEKIAESFQLWRAIETATLYKMAEDQRFSVS